MDQLPPPPEGFTEGGQAASGGPPAAPAGFTEGGTAPAEESYRSKVERTGAALEKAVGGKTVGEAGLSGVAKAAVGAGEAALAMGTGVVGDIAGAATSVLTQNPKRGESVRKALTTQPATEAGRATQDYVSALTSPVMTYLSKPSEALERAGHPIASQVTRAAIDVAPLKVPKVARAVGETARETVRPAAEVIAKAGEARTAVRAAEEAPKQAAIAQAKTLGIRLAPSEAGGPAGKVLEGVAGKIRTEQELSRANAKVINRTVAKEIGLSDRQPLSPANIERQKQAAIAVYDRVRAAGRISRDDAFKQEMEAVKDRTGQEALDYPEDTSEAIDKEIAKFNVESADSASMLSKIKKLREKAAKDMGAPDADKFELGLARKKIATAMENLIERNLQPGPLPRRGMIDPNLIKDFRAARQQLAKIYNVEEAMSPHGNVSAAVLARQLKRGVPLSGNLKALAETYTEFPKVMRYVDTLGGHAPFSALDYLVGGVEAVAHPERAAAIVATLGTRPLARMAIKSRPYQAVGIKPREVKPGAVTRAARALARPRTLKERPGYTPPVKVEDEQDQR